MTTVTVRFGVESVTKNFPGPVTVCDVRRDPNIKATLAYGDNVRTLMNGIALPDDAVLQSGSVVTIETAANQKAELVASC